MAADVNTCVIYADNFIVNNRLIVCSYCSQCYHVNCVMFRDALHKQINDCKNLLWFCDACIGQVREKLDISKQLQTIQQTSAKVLQNMEQVKENKEEIGNQRWLDIAKRNNSVPPFIIKSKNADQARAAFS